MSLYINGQNYLLALVSVYSQSHSIGAQRKCNAIPAKRFYQIVILQRDMGTNM